MVQSAAKDVTQLLIDWRDGDPEALATLMPLVYEELRRQAERYMRRERQDHTLQPTALVHETYLQSARTGSSRRGRRHAGRGSSGRGANRQRATRPPAPGLAGESPIS